VTGLRPVISCLIVDKGTGVAVGAENRIVMTLDGKKIEEKFLEISKGDPTEVRVTYRPAEDLTPGLHTVGIRAEDVVENVANARWRFTVDNQPPEIGRVWPEPGAVAAVARPVIQAAVKDDGGVDAKGVRLFIDGRSAPGRAWSDPAAGVVSVALDADLAPGEHEAELAVADKAGQETRKTWKFVVDLEPPAMAEAAARPDGSVTFAVRDQFSAARPVEVRLDGRRVEEGKDGYTFDAAAGTVTLAPRALEAGRRRVSVVLSDALGNTSTPEWTFDVRPGGAAAAAVAAGSEAGTAAKPAGETPAAGKTPLVAPAALAEAEGKPAAKPGEAAATAKPASAEAAKEAPSGALSNKTLLIFGGAGAALVGLLVLARKK